MSTVIRKSQPAPSDVHVDRPLGDMSLAFLQDQDGFVADQVFPQVPVSNQSDSYYTYDRGMFNRNQAKKRAPGAESAEGGHELSTDTYSADVWAIHSKVPDQVRANADSPIDPDRDATAFLSHQLLISKEAEWASNFFAASIWTTDVTPGTLWDAASSTPIADVEAGKVVVRKSTGFEPNTMVMGREVWAALKNNADIIDRLNRGQTTGPAMALKSAMAELFEVDRIIVGGAIQNTAAEGVANVHDFLLGKHALLCYVPSSPGLMTPAAGYTFSWTGYTGAGAGGQRVSRFREDLVRSDRIEMELAYDQKLVAADLGYFFESVVS